jgi:hypothetical protein
MRFLKPRGTASVSNQLKSVRQRLERWRRTKTHRSRIPEELWASASELAGEYGLAKTAKALRLDYYTLKERLQASGGATSREGQVQPTFVEFVPQVSGALCECTVELEDQSGARMRIHLKGTTMPDLSRLNDGFWRNRA